MIEPGRFSRRGGVIDIFPIAAAHPVRIDFFDDEIDTLRIFDPSTQRSDAYVNGLTITPAREVLPEHLSLVNQQLTGWFQTLPPAEDDMTTPITDADALANGAAFPYMEHYLSYAYPNPVGLLDYAADNALVVVEDWDELSDVISDIEANALRTREEKIETGSLAPDHPVPYLDAQTLAESLANGSILHFNHSAETLAGIFTPGGRFGGQLRPLLANLRDLRGKGERVVVVTEQAPRLSQLWREQDPDAYVPIMTEIDDPPGTNSLTFINGTLHEGWSLALDDTETHLLTDAEIFGWGRPEPRRRKSGGRTRPPEAVYADWQEGDYVVHVDYGIGQFGGMRHRTIDGNDREYLLVQYAGTDLLFVPIHQTDRLTRYIGADDTPPKLSKLGQQEWSKVKSRARKAAEDAAEELLAIYAARAEASGHAFEPDTPWQHELEATFPYVETEDQLRAVYEVKADMEISQPMDRLICGDVGYGKTEVALRAAFKAVMDGKQVAVLVPTTVLAQQHYETFSNRLAPFPVKVEMMSRFRTKEQQGRILPRIASGEVDVIIGTHRILSKDVTFKDLGLIVIDEEQRFGVKQKEHFKKLRREIDVLTLTATPIPRTLYMSLTGVRDISMIQTPPEERLPVVTHVGRFDANLTRQAIIREIERGGQVFVVHNRIRTIDALRAKLEEIVPEARIVSAHGQMNEQMLGSVMLAFARGEFDVLLSTRHHRKRYRHPQRQHIDR